MKKLIFIIPFIMALFTIGCARMGSPDGGWYDEDPPKVIATMPQDRSVSVIQKKINIFFDEFVTIDNATENVIISPPQIEQAEIKSRGRSITVVLKDTLKENTTYTVDFSNAIKDNNEGNYMGNYTYSFSTGTSIDTMEVGGYVLEAETLEPIPGIQVGLYAATDSAENDSSLLTLFYNEPMMRVSRTDQNGHFTIKGVKHGRYRAVALADMDNNFMLTPKSGERLAFDTEIIVPSVFDDIRQDTTMLDSLRIKSIDRVPFKHFMPDNIMLRAFAEPKTERAFLKAERPQPERLDIYFTYGDTLLPEIKGVNIDLEGQLLLEASKHNDTLSYWLRDTMLVNMDSLEIEMTYRKTDSLGVLQYETEPLALVPKVLYEKRMKQQQKEREDWEKKQAKKKKRGEAYDSIWVEKPLEIKYISQNTLAPDQNIAFSFTTPIETLDTARVHLYFEQDSTWYDAPFTIREKPNTNIRTFEIVSDWKPSCQYSFELDSMAFTDIYGKVTAKAKQGIKIKALEELGTLTVSLTSMKGQNVIAHLIEGADKIAKEVYTNTGEVKFEYVSEKEYYLRIIVDSNGNGLWDTGDFDSLTQPEEVYYYPKQIACRAKWDIAETWDPKKKPLNEQKPAQLRKTKGAEAKRKQAGKNLRRAQQMGIMLPDYLK